MYLGFSARARSELAPPEVPSVTALRHEFDGRYLQLASTASKAVQVVPATLQGSAVGRRGAGCRFVTQQVTM